MLTGLRCFQGFLLPGDSKTASWQCWITELMWISFLLCFEILGREVTQQVILPLELNEER